MLGLAKNMPKPPLSTFALATHRVLPIENTNENGNSSKLALLAEDSTGWALMPESDYNQLLRYFSSGPKSSSQVDIKSRDILVQLEKAGLVKQYNPSLTKCQNQVSSTRTSSPPRTFLIKMTGSCNYACEYCYDYNDNRFSRHLDPERALELIKSFLMAGQKRLRILFHGGEPLLRFNDIERIVDEVKSLANTIENSHVSFSIQTNGYFLTPSIIDFFLEHDFSVGISCDGFDERANSLRKARNGSSTLAPIMDFLERYPDFIRHRVGFLAVVTKQSLPHIPSYVLELQCRGVKTFSFNYMDEEGSGQSLASQSLSLSDSLTLFRDLVSLIEEKLIWSISIEPILSRISNLFSLSPKDYCYKGPCGASSEFMVLDADGGLRTCDCSDNEFFHFGDSTLKPEEILAKAHPIQQQIVERHTYLKELGADCKDCALFGLCGGTCVAQAIIRTSDHHNVDPLECAISKFFYPYLLMQYSLHNTNAPIFQYFFQHYPQYSSSQV